MMGRCERRETTCKSRLRRARSGRAGLGHRLRFAQAEASGVGPGDTTPVHRPGQAEGAIELYLREIGKVGVLSARAERALAVRAQRGDKQAREQLLKSGLRLVVTLAREYEGIGLSLFDLIAEGNLGLMKAVGRFDPTSGDQLSTLAPWWIRQAIKRALANYARSRRHA